jgi:hypothetical protein
LAFQGVAFELTIEKPSRVESNALPNQKNWPFEFMAFHHKFLTSLPGSSYTRK